ENAQRVTQLLNKTNQFNLTTRRHTASEIQNMLLDDKVKIFAYREADRFGDNGIIAVVVVDLKNEIPVISEFVMSCRVMGKNIENAIIDDVEEYLQNKGFAGAKGEFIPTAKNKPVANLYSNLGYTESCSDGEHKIYEIRFSEKPARNYILEKVIL
nr:hypothetical protein [Eubacterium sp.]